MLGGGGSICELRLTRELVKGARFRIVKGLVTFKIDFKRAFRVTKLAPLRLGVLRPGVCRRQRRGAR